MCERKTSAIIISKNKKILGRNIKILLFQKAEKSQNKVGKSSSTLNTCDQN